MRALGRLGDHVTPIRLHHHASGVPDIFLFLGVKEEQHPSPLMGTGTTRHGILLPDRQPWSASLPVCLPAPLLQFHPASCSWIETKLPFSKAPSPCSVSLHTPGRRTSERTSKPTCLITTLNLRQWTRFEGGAEWFVVGFDFLPRHLLVHLIIAISAIGGGPTSPLI